jgi:hypothetical protein
MISISRSMLLTAGLLAFPLAGAVAQAVDTGKSTGPSSASTGDHKVDARNGEAAMKSTAPGYESTGEVNGANGKSSGNAATGQSGKKPAPP